MYFGASLDVKCSTTVHSLDGGIEEEQSRDTEKQVQERKRVEGQGGCRGWPGRTYRGWLQGGAEDAGCLGFRCFVFSRELKGGWEGTVQMYIVVGSPLLLHPPPVFAKAFQKEA